MILRPHHLLCTQAYEGKGYSDTFVENMNEKVKLLREVPNYEIELKIDLDNLCSHCPSNKGTVCESEEKVKSMDHKVCKYFNLSEGTYVYKEVIEKIKLKITKEIMKDICGNCEWYNYGICERLILKEETK